MKKYCIEWETCFCEDYPERSGNFTVEAESEKEAISKAQVPFHSVIIGLNEIKESVVTSGEDKLQEKASCGV